MARRRLPRGRTSALGVSVLDPSEVVFDQDILSVRFGDGATAGGSSMFGRYSSMPSFGYSASITPRFDIEHDSIAAVPYAVHSVVPMRAHKWAGGADTRLTTLSAAVEDHVGWDGTGGGNPFVEAIKGEATAQANGASIYGGIFIASIPLGVAAKYAVGAELTSVNNSTDATEAFSSVSFTAAGMATNGLAGGDPARVSDVGFLINPLSKNDFQRGFFVAGKVKFAAFAAIGSMKIGLDMSGVTASYAGICLGDGSSSVIRAGSALGNMFSASGTTLSIGSDATAIGFRGAAPVARPTLPSAATDAASVQSLVNALRTAVINQGLGI